MSGPEKKGLSGAFAKVANVIGDYASDIKSYYSKDARKERKEYQKSLKEKWEKDNWTSGTNNQTLGQTISSALTLMKPYWATKEGKWGWWYLGSSVALSFATTGIGIFSSILNGQVVDHMQMANQQSNAGDLAAAAAERTAYLSYTAAWFASIGGLIATSVYNIYQSQKLHRDWSRSMTNHMLDKYTSNQTSARLQTIYNNVDNPQDRIGNDVDAFTQNATMIPIGMMNSLISAGGFLGQLWVLSDKASLNIGGNDYSWPGWLAQGILLYAVLGTGLVHKVGKALPAMLRRDEKYRADFIYGMARVRENAKSIVSFKGESVERAALKEKYVPIYDNTLEIMKRRKLLGWVQNYYGEASDLAPFLLLGLPVAFGDMSYGAMVQGRIAMGRVERGASWVANSYDFLAGFKATTDRLTTFVNAIEKSEQDLKRNIRYEGKDGTTPAGPA